jgi:hypothetical protein
MLARHSPILRHANDVLGTKDHFEHPVTIGAQALIAAKASILESQHVPELVHDHSLRDSIRCASSISWETLYSLPQSANTLRLCNRPLMEHSTNSERAILATGIMLLAFLSAACALILDSVAAMRWEAKRNAYLAEPLTPKSLAARFEIQG